MFFEVKKFRVEDWLIENQERNGSIKIREYKNYSWNWPYDFFSLVELIKMDASVEFCDIDNETGGIIPIEGD